MPRARSTGNRSAQALARLRRRNTRDRWPVLATASYLVYCGYDLAARRYAHHALSTRGHAILHQLLLQPQHRRAGRRRRIPLPPVFALGTGRGRDQPRRRLLHRDQLAGLPAAGWLVFASRGVRAAAGMGVGAAGLQVAGLVDAGRRAAVPASPASAGTAACSICAATTSACPRCRSRCCSSPCATTNWSLMAAIVYVLMPAGVGRYPTVLGVLLFAAVATAIAHIPAGIGVLEAVFVALLGQLVRRRSCWRHCLRTARSTSWCRCCWPWSALLAVRGARQGTEATARP